jgi:hypothetical protein
MKPRRSMHCAMVLGTKIYSVDWTIVENILMLSPMKNLSPAFTDNHLVQSVESRPHKPFMVHLNMKPTRIVGDHLIQSIQKQPRHLFVSTF